MIPRFLFVGLSILLGLSISATHLYRQPWHSRITPIAGGSVNSFIIDEHGDLFSFGVGRDSRLGHGSEEDQGIPKKIATLAGKKILHVNVTFAHTLITTETNEVYTIGSVEKGQAGYMDDDALVPKKVNTPPNIKVIQAVSGLKFSLILSETGLLYFMGNEDIYRETKRGFIDGQPKIVDALKDRKIIQIEAGINHAVALDAHGNIHGWGKNFIYKSGRYLDTHVPEKIEGLEGVKIIQIATSGNLATLGNSTTNFHVLALAENGDVYSFGGGDFGQLGLGTFFRQHIPKKIPGLKNIIKIAAGAGHSLALDDQGNVLSWGYGRPLGHDDKQDQLEPKKIESLSSVRIVDIAAGVEHSLLLDEDGNVYVIGSAFYKPAKSQINKRVPTKIEGIKAFIPQTPWRPDNHSYFSKDLHNKVKTMLLTRYRQGNGKGILVGSMPRVLIYEVFKHLVKH